MTKTKKLPAHLRTFKLTAAERLQLMERDALISLLGLAPEDRSSAGSRYAFTTGEFRREAIADGLLSAVRS